MYQDRARKAYQHSLSSALSDREADAQCFRNLISELRSVEHSTEFNERREALSKHQRLWSLIQKANAYDTGLVPNEDRILFSRLADQAQKYGIRAILNSELSITPLIDMAQSVLEGLTGDIDTIASIKK
ncbi:flagellar biosynthesis regulator FlaF [Acetobacteraceae bacterium ESL0709]|nr:flagellar biosynthesis regulator FlaF [Acetobacteraceae bacterium ESL0697]MDF7679027.1 flagellar biosynthesis regulator FlaF [Acetobacteraceae bacterium ESL0709]